MPDMNMQTFEELQRHQLVTEFDIQSQSELEDYQVKLDNVANPTQAQDNLIVGVDGKSLPHWNESVDFDTWIKTNIATSGKRGFLIHGNAGLGSGSNIDDTMEWGDDFPGSSINASKWDGNTELTSVSDGVMSITGAESTAAITSITNFIPNTFVVYRGTFADSVDHYVGFGELADWTVEGIRRYARYSTWGAYAILASTTTRVSSDEGDANFTDYGLKWETAKYSWYSNDVESTNSPIETNIPTATLPLIIKPYDNGVTWQFDSIYVRKYTAIEPTAQISTPKNISTALKSFGRAG